jgi:guanosine-3',5'-bis(diphosphate) 3'-pyrophosphohydrolase
MIAISDLLKALHFAADKHRDQRRKDVHASPYINHPIQVAQILAETGGVEDIEVLMAAILHDTVEDTETTLSELEQVFGARVARIVGEVTDDTGLPKAERKRLQIEHAREISGEGALVKIADKTANIQDIATNPPAGWDAARRQQYLAWAEQVVASCPPVNGALEANFASTLRAAHRTLGV